MGISLKKLFVLNNVDLAVSYTVLNNSSLFFCLGKKIWNGIDCCMSLTTICAIAHFCLFSFTYFSLLSIGRNTESNSMSRKNDNNNFALRMSYPIYDEFDGPFLPPPGMGGPGMMGGPGARMMEGRWGPDMRRRGRGGQGGGPRRGPGPMGPDGMGMGRDGMGMGDMGRGMGGGPSMGGWGPGGGGPGGPQFGRDKAVGRMSLKDMAARTTQSYDAEVISSMNNRNKNNNNQLRGDSMGPVMGQQQRAGGGPASNPTSTANQYVPLSSTYGPQATERSPPLTVGAPPPPPPIIETRASPDLSSETSSSSSSTPSTVQTARSVRPSVVLVTSTGVRNENSQGSGFVVEFDDAADESDIEEVDRCYILTSAHVAPPGWKVSVTFPSDPDKQYPATVVGRKLNSDLALLAVESAIDDNDEDPFPPPLIMSSEDILTDTKSSSSSSSSITSNEIGSPLYAFGYPMGLEGPTMTSGILSATTKGINYMDAPTGEEPSEISKSRPFEKTNFVITDAAMAGGMSGGPLVNSEGVVLGVNALVRPDLRALGNYAVSSIECESFLEKLEDQRDVAKQASKKVDARSERRKKRKEARKSEDSTTSSSDSSSDDDEVPADGVAGYRVMLYGYSTSKAEATTILRRAAGLDELRAENAMRSAYSFGAGVVDEFYVSEAGDRKRAEKAARKKADDLFEKLKEEGMMVEVEPLTLLP
jgi:S1-C subfamily serine protease